MIGSFARILGRGPRTLQMDQTQKALAEADDAPPAGFVARLSDEGGDVFLAPVLDSLRAALRRHRDASPAEPEAATPDTPTEPRP